MDQGTSSAQARPSEGGRPSLRDRLPEEFRAAIDFHGHLCPGLTIGYRAARIALDRLGAERGLDEELLGIVENDACGVDAFQFVTGCTIGKGNLVYHDYGKQVFTLVRRSDGRGVRVALRATSVEGDPERDALRARVLAGEASDEERALFYDAHGEQSLELLEMPDEQFGSITEVEVPLPQKAQIFPSVVCSVCGEPFMEPRGRVRDGQPCCIPCSTRYGRGWEING